MKGDSSAGADLPPTELLRDNFNIATHVAVVVLEEMEIVDRIYSDSGKLGYIIQKNSGKLLNVYKGHFGKKSRIQYSIFLEYSPGLEKASLDTVLVFMRQHDDELKTIDVGQFIYSQKLGNLLRETVK